MKIYVGCCGIPQGLSKYSQVLKVVEINSTFYKLPQLKTVQKWREMVPKDFIFTIKAYQGITHPITSPTWRKSGIRELEKLKDKVGFLKPTNEVFQFWSETLKISTTLNSPICLIQLPASFKESKENIENAGEFFSAIERRKVSIALELRGWSQERFREICQKFDLISCTDLFESEPLWFSEREIGYFRLHGSYEKGRINYNYKYTQKELKWLIRKIESLQKLKEVYCFFNNFWMWEDAIQLQNLLKMEGYE